MVELAGNHAQFSFNEAGLTANGKAVTLTYVPLHSSKLLNRGYNQAGLLARALSRRHSLPLQDLLCKQHPTPAQNQLGFDERRRNLEGSVTLKRGARLKGESVIRKEGAARLVLVDDVYTTGSTTAECARVLREGLGVDVTVWTFARTVRRSGG
jgi:ComF family protein